MVDYVDQTGPNGTEDNMGGTAMKIYYAPVRDFNVIAKPTATPTSLDDLVEISTAHTMKSGKKLLELYVTMDTGEIDDEPQGERDARSFLSKCKFKHPGMNATILGFASQAKNDKFIFFIPLADGTVRQIGTEQFYAECIGKLVTGKNGSGYRGYEGEIQAFGPKLYIYTAALPLTPAV